MGRSSAAPVLGGGSSALVLTAEAVVHAYADVAAQGWIADYVLILLVQEIGYAGVDGSAAEEAEGCGEVKSAVAGILRDARAEAGAGDPEAEEIAVGAHAGEISDEVYIEAAVGAIENERAGI